MRELTQSLIECCDPLIVNAAEARALVGALTDDESGAKALPAEKLAAGALAAALSREAPTSRMRLVQVARSQR